MIGNGDGTFRAVSTNTAASPGSAQVADLNGDGVLDVVTGGPVTSGGSSPLLVLLGNADSFGRRNNFVYDVDLLTIHGARSALDWSKKQQTSISRELGMLGAYQSRLQAARSVLDTTRINSMAASSRITDADIAAESADLVRLQILQQSGQSILAQANLQPQIALQLLRGL